jgi:hypothetical protein
MLGRAFFTINHASDMRELPGFPAKQKPAEAGGKPRRVLHIWL